MAATRLTCAVLLSLSLAACAGVQKRAPLPSENFDEQKIATVNLWAEAHGAKLIWLHYPTRNPADPAG